MKRKYFIGDKVKVIDNIKDHYFDIGEIVIIKNIFTTNHNYEYYARSLNGGYRSWSIMEKDVISLKEILKNL